MRDLERESSEAMKCMEYGIAIATERAEAGVTTSLDLHLKGKDDAIAALAAIVSSMVKRGVTTPEITRAATLGIQDGMAVKKKLN